MWNVSSVAVAATDHLSHVSGETNVDLLKQSSNSGCPPYYSHFPGSCGGETAHSRLHVHVGGINEKGIRQFFEAMSLISISEKRGWEQARLSCSPIVFEQESCPCYFLRSAADNPWEAAARACAFWNERINFFQERAFEAISAGSDNCAPTGLTIGDLEILDTGSLQLLPCDCDGKSVLFIDRLTLLPRMHRDTKGRLRVLWYLMQKSYTSRHPQAYRFTTIVLCSQPPNSGYNWAFSAGCLRITSVMPLQVDMVHLLTLPAVTGTGRVLQAVMATCVRMLGSLYQGFAKVHHGSTFKTSYGTASENSAKQHLCQELKKYGFTKKGLPEAVGGQFSLRLFRNWVKLQHSIEQQSVNMDEQRVQRKREMNRVHSKQKRRRRQEEFEQLQSHVLTLRCANERSKEVYKELQHLIDRAQILVSGLTKHTLDSSFSENIETMPSLLVLPQSVRSTRAALSAERVFENDLNDVNESEGCDVDDISSMLAALEPDPIAPSCLPQTSLHHLTNYFNQIGSEELGQPSRKLKSWDDYQLLYPQMPQPSDRLLDAARLLANQKYPRFVSDHPFFTPHQSPNPLSETVLAPPNLIHAATSERNLSEELNHVLLPFPYAKHPLLDPRTAPSGSQLFNPSRRNLLLNDQDSSPMSTRSSPVKCPPNQLIRGTAVEPDYLAYISSFDSSTNHPQKTLLPTTINTLTNHLNLKSNLLSHHLDYFSSIQAPSMDHQSFTTEGYSDETFDNRKHI